MTAHPDRAAFEQQQSVSSMREVFVKNKQASVEYLTELYNSHDIERVSSYFLKGITTKVYANNSVLDIAIREIIHPFLHQENDTQTAHIDRTLRVNLIRYHISPARIHY